MVFIATASACAVAFFFFQAEDGIRDLTVTGVQTCALPIFQRARVPGRDGAVVAEGRFQRGQHLDGGSRPRTIVLHERLPARQSERDDLAVEEAIVARSYRGGLALDRITVLLVAADLLPAGDVLSGLAHGDVDVRILLGVAGHQLCVVGVRRVRVAAAIPRDTFDTNR